MEVVARALVEVLESEVVHLRRDGCIQRSRTSDGHPTCGASHSHSMSNLLRLLWTYVISLRHVPDLPLLPHTHLSSLRS